MEEEESADGQQKRAIRRNETIGEGNSSSKEEREIDREEEERKRILCDGRKAEGKRGAR